MKSIFFRLFAISLIAALSACSGANATTTPIPTVVFDTGSNNPEPVALPLGGVKASGFVTASASATLAFGVAGRLSVVHIAEGDTVQAGDLLAELENTTQQIELVQAEQNLSQLTSPVAIAQASQTLAQAQKDLEDAQKKVDAIQFKRASDVKLDNLQAEIDLAEETLARAQSAYKTVARKPDGDTGKAAALLAMTNAQLRLNALISEQNWLTGKVSATDAAILQANLEAAKATFQEAGWYLNALKGEKLPDEARGARLAALVNAQNAVILAKEHLNATRLIAPMDGQIISLELGAGEYALPGQSVVGLSNVTLLQVETTDLSEKDVALVAENQIVSVYVKALGKNASGKVLRISPIASTLGGDVVYKTIIQLDQPYPGGLREGMSVDVTFGEAE